MTAADSGDDSEPGLARRRGGGNDPAAGPRQRRGMFAGQDDDFEAIRQIIASASLPGAAEEQQAGQQTGPQAGRAEPAPAPAARKPMVAPQPAPAAAARPLRPETEGRPAEGRSGADSGAAPGAPPAPGSLARGRGRLGPDRRPAAGGAPPPPPPPPDDIILQQRGTGRGPRRTTGLLVAGGILLLLILAGGGAWYGMEKGLIPLGPASTDNGVPLVTAEKEPMKVTPQDRGGMTIPDQDKQIYERLAGLDDPALTEERLLPPPELPLVDGPSDGSDEPDAAGAPPADQAETSLAAAPMVSGRDVVVAPLSSSAPTESPSAESPSAAGPAANPPEAGRPERIEDLLPPPEVRADAGAGQGQAVEGESADRGVASGEPASREAVSPTAPAAPEAGRPASILPGPEAAPADDTDSNGSVAAASAVPAPPSIAAGVEDITPGTDGDGAPAEVGGDEGEARVATPMPASRPVAQLAAPQAVPQAAPQAAPPPADAIMVQLAAVREAAAAQAEWRRLQSRHGATLSALTPRYQEVDIPDRGRFIRIQAGPFPSREAAAAACATLDSEGQGCFVVRN